MYHVFLIVLGVFPVPLHDNAISFSTPARHQTFCSEFCSECVEKDDPILSDWDYRSAKFECLLKSPTFEPLKEDQILSEWHPYIWSVRCLFPYSLGSIFWTRNKIQIRLIRIFYTLRSSPTFQLFKIPPCEPFRRENAVCCKVNFPSASSTSSTNCFKCAVNFVWPVFSI